jgi:hypothetical protein
MSYCTPCPPCDSEYPLLCEPLETTANGKRLVVEDSAACQKTIQAPTTGQVLTSNNGTLGWTSGGNSTVLSKSSSGNLEFGKVQTDYITDSAITTIKIDDDAINAAKIVDGAVIGSKIPDKTITNAKLRDSAALSVIGRSNDTAGVPADIISATDGDVLRRSGTSIGFGKIGYLSMEAGGIVNVINASSITSFTITAAAGGPQIIPLDNTVPQITEGIQVLSATITPKKTGNKIFGLISFNGDASVATLAMVASVFKNGAASAFASTWSQAIASASLVSFDFFDEATSVSPINYTVRVGPTAAGTIWINRNNASELLGDTNFIRFTLFEINA